MILNIARCPHCGGTSFAVKVETWVQVEAAEDHSNEYPHFGNAEFDEEDAAYAEPLDRGEIICRNPHCNATFHNTTKGEPVR